ncbi:MAG: GHKL domain-containing protein [Ruminococcus flavefaciens]|nr:GHKL domain-containing protein [Ruminococcus flavefaciens]
MQKFLFVRQIIDAGLTAVILSFHFKAGYSKCFVLSVVFVGLLWVADFIAILLYPALVQQTADETGIKNFLMVILAKLFLFLIIVIMNNVFRHNDIKYVREKDWLTFLILPFFSIAITSAFIRNVQVVMGTELERLFVGLAFGLVCMNIIMFYFMQNVGKQEYLLREKALLDLETRNKIQLYEIISKKVQSQREISHEYKNQLTCIQSLCEKEEYDKLKEYLKQINGEVIYDLDCIDTNHVFVNAVINAKYQEAVQKHILIVCKVNDLSDLTMNSSDLVILLSNLLNNAIEACEKCKKERVLKLKCICEENEFILSIKNTYDGKLNKAGENLYTTKVKERESHGIGLKNVIQVIEKNKGYYAIEHTENEFHISVVIPQRAHE